MSRIEYPRLKEARLAANRQFYAKKTVEYGGVWHARTPLPHPDPRNEPTSPFSAGIAPPFRHWAFTSAADRDAFVRRHPGAESVQPESSMSQTPDQLKELGRIFTAVGNGAQWQFASTTRPEMWHEPEPGFSPLRAAEIGYLIRVKPDPYAEVKAAYAAGQTIQHRYRGGISDEWFDSKIEPQWLGNMDYRVKPPAPVPVPLGPKDITPGSVVGIPSRVTGTWFTVLSVYAGGVTLNTEKSDYTWQELADGWLIKRPGEDWKPCSKEPT